MTLREAGLATHYVPSSHIHTVEEALQGLGRTLQREGRQGPWELARVAHALDAVEQAAGPLPQGGWPGGPVVCSAVSPKLMSAVGASCNGYRAHSHIRSGKGRTATPFNLFTAKP